MGSSAAFARARSSRPACGRQSSGSQIGGPAGNTASTGSAPIVPDERIVCSYEMHLDDFDDPALRETGTNDLQLDALGAYLAQTPASA